MQWAAAESGRSSNARLISAPSRLLGLAAQQQKYTQPMSSIEVSRIFGDRSATLFFRLGAVDGALIVGGGIRDNIIR